MVAAAVFVVVLIVLSGTIHADRASDIALLQSEDFFDALSRNDPDFPEQLYAKNFVWFAPGRPTITTRSGLRSALSALASSSSGLMFDITKFETVRTSKKTILFYLDADVRGPDGNFLRTLRVVVLSKKMKGKWRFIRDMSNNI